jgi:hypothetical protein
MAPDPVSTSQATTAAVEVVHRWYGLSWGDIAALVGAAAWIPQIWRYFQRPKVTPIVGGQIEIGYTHFGPLFNPKIAFRVEKRAALVTGIEFAVVHERHQSTQFRCNQLVEYGSFSESTSGEKAVHQRQQDVVAVVLNPMSIVERKANCREVNCLNQLEQFNIGLGSAVDRLRGTSTNWIDELQRSREYVDLTRFLEESFIWQSGKYSVECSVNVAGQKRPSKCKFQFVLGETSLASLRNNATTIKENFRRSLMPPDTVYAEKTPDINWIYPNVFDLAAST